MVLLAFVFSLIGFGAYDTWAKRRTLYSMEHDDALRWPANYRAQLNASRVFIDQRLWAFALAYAQRAIAIHPERASGWINASTAAGGLQAWQLCHTYLEKAFDIYPARQLAVNLSYVCRMLGKESEALMYEAMLPELSDNLRLKEPTQ